MEPKSIGVLDIGSNTVLLTAGYLDDSGQCVVLYEDHDVARLSEGLQEGGPLRPEAKARVLEVVRRFQKNAHAHGVHSLYAAGTAAFRRASDGAQFAKDLEQTLQIPVRILSGEEEAHYSYLSAQYDFGSAEHTVGMIDIGGGSTELVWSPQGTGVSLPLGTVRLLEGFVRRHPIEDEIWEKMRRSIRSILKNAPPLHVQDRPRHWVAVAATPTALACLMQGLANFDVKKVHGFILERRSLGVTIEKLRRLSIPEREVLPGMAPKRAELLPLGGLILWEIMEFFQLPEVIASHHGLRYGWLREILQTQNSFTR